MMSFNVKRINYWILNANESVFMRIYKTNYFGVIC